MSIMSTEKETPVRYIDSKWKSDEETPVRYIDSKWKLDVRYIDSKWKSDVIANHIYSYL